MEFLNEIKFDLNKYWIILASLGVLDLAVLHFHPTKSKKIKIRDAAISTVYSFLNFNVQLGIILGVGFISRPLYELRFFNLVPGGALYWVSLYFLQEFFFYWNHRCNHGLAFLWATHGVHHTSTQMSVFSGMRSIKLGFFSFTWFFYIPLILLGFKLQHLAWSFSMLMIFQTVMHMEWFPKLGILEKFVMTPHNHCLHHVVFKEPGSCNYGGSLVIFDRLFGTFVGDVESPRHYGVHGVDLEKQKLLTPVWVAFQPLLIQLSGLWRSGQK